MTKKEKDFSSYSCEQCGAKVILSKTSKITMCPYCGSSIVKLPSLLSSSNIVWIIPFRVGSDEVLSRIYKKNFFCNSNNLKSVSKLYVPCYICDIQTVYHGTYTINNNENNTRCEKSLNGVISDKIVLANNKNCDMIEDIDFIDINKKVPFNLFSIEDEIIECGNTYDVNELARRESLRVCR